MSNGVDFDKQYWFQCTDLARAYADAVRGIKSWPFWWAAKNASLTTFPWTKMLSPWPWNDLKQWDILIQWAIAWNIYWHVWIVHKADRFGYYLIEQNWYDGTGSGIWNNAVRINYYNWSSRPILRFFRK